MEMKHMNIWKLKRGVEIEEILMDEGSVFHVSVNGAFVTAIFPHTPKGVKEMRKALDRAVEGGFSVGRLIEKALNRME